MIRRGERTGEVPPELMVYSPAQWPSAAAWGAARRDWLAGHRPASLDALNAFYGPDVVFPPVPDPREVPDA